MIDIGKAAESALKELGGGKGGDDRGPKGVHVIAITPPLKSAADDIFNAFKGDDREKFCEALCDFLDCRDKMPKGEETEEGELSDEED